MVGGVFYPGSRPNEIRTGTANSFDEAKARFERAADLLRLIPHR